jgi:hypothetical protein
LRSRTLLLALGFAASGCALDKAVIPSRPSTLVVHGVLSSTAPTQTILVERTLTGEVTLYPYVPIAGGAPVGSFSSGEQVVSDWGNPESGAIVEVTTPSGQVVTAQEYKTFTTLGNGAGMYRIQIAGGALVPGGRYSLRLRTVRGEVATAETIIPAIASTAAPAPESFDRAGAPLALAWAQTGNARGYEVRVDNPYMPWLGITENTSVALQGSLRNTGSDNLAHVFIPGFRQNISVSAVDENLYEYYRTVNSGFTGSGIVNRMTGATGVFGSFVTIARKAIDVVAPQTQPIEGTFDLLPLSAGGFYGGAVDARAMTIYVESPSAKAGQPDALTARIHRTSTFGVFAAVGTKLRDSVRINYLNQQTLSDTADWFKGTLRGDTLDGQYSKGAKATYVRRKP